MTCDNRHCDRSDGTVLHCAHHLSAPTATCGFARSRAGDVDPQSAIGNPQSRKGFTLLELLVAMLMMVTIASCLYGALHTGFRARRSALIAVEPTTQAINAIELLKQDIYGVLPPGGVLAGAFIGTDSAGIRGVDTDSLEFYTTHVYASDEQMAGAVGHVSVLLEEDPNGQYGSYMLVRQVTTNLLPLRDVIPDEQILCRHVVSLNFRYFGDDWVDDWDSTTDANSLPRAVEIDIQVAQQEEDAGGGIGREPPKRRLVQSFAIPCEAAAQEQEAASTP